MARSSWADEYERRGREKEKSRQRARERTEERRRSEINAARSRGREEGLDRYQIRDNMDAIKNEHKAQDWDKRQAHEHRMYDYHYGKTAQRRGIKEMEDHARRRKEGLDYIDRVNSGEVEYTGNNLEGDVKSGRHWSQGAMDAYDYYNENRQDIKRGNTDFYYSDYVPKNNRNNKRPTYEQYMGKYYDPNYGKPTYGNPQRGGGRDGGGRGRPDVSTPTPVPSYGGGTGGSPFKDIPEDFRHGAGIGRQWA